MCLQGETAMAHRLTSLVLLLFLPIALAAEWPQYRAGPKRQARSPEPLPSRLVAAWHLATPPPDPAWPRSDRMAFDRAPQPVVAGGRVFFGHSADGAVYAVDLATGDVEWKFFTEAPIRFAPATWSDRVIVGSDDGSVYALRQEDGELLWRMKAAPGDDLVLGNGRVISKWPVRGGPVVRNDVVYCAAGIWPSEGVYLYALDPGDGAVRWKNDRAGEIYMGQPHGGAYAQSGVAAQGHLVATEHQLLVPTGRAVPAVFDRATGKFLYFHLQRYGQKGGALAMAVGDVFFNQGWGYDADRGDKQVQIDAEQVAAGDGYIDAARGNKLWRLRWVVEERADRRGKKRTVKTLKPEWSVTLPFRVTSLSIAGDEPIVGGSGKVAIVDPKTRRIRWQAEVDGNAYGLAVAQGRLVVATDKGIVTCFSSSGRGVDRRASARAAPTATRPRGRVAPANRLHQRLPEKGFAAVLSFDDLDELVEVIRGSSLKFVMVEPERARAEALRQRLASSGVAMRRIAIWNRPPGDTHLPKYFANIVICGRDRRWDDVTWDAIMREARRLRRPYGGLLAVRSGDRWSIDVRGDLEGAGSWSHQYGDAANRLNSGDRLVEGRLTALWFRDIPFDVPQRHGRGPAPLFAKGRLIHEGLDGIICVDAYNGSELWRYALPGVLRAYDGDELMGVAGTGSNLCIGGDSLFVRYGSKCDQVLLESGERVRTFEVPASSGDSPPWGYLASDGERLYGTSSDAEHVVTYRYIDRGGDMKRLLTESRSLFAYDVASGKLLWQYDAGDSIRHNAIALAGDRVILIDRPQARFDRLKKSTDRDHPMGTLISLDAATGAVQWKNSGAIFGTVLIAVPERNAVIMSYQPTRFRLDSERGGRMAVFRMSDGKRLWDHAARYASRPLVVGDTIYAQGGAWDLSSGKPKDFPFKRSYGCGILAAAEKMLLFRSATLGYCSLEHPAETLDYGGIRPGCWVNAIPVGGIVVMPDASAGCRCSYLNQAWMAFEGRPLP